ncbi:hypothetical protein ACFL0T_06140 [Candidatus Omnitrophota bacterium]
MEKKRPKGITALSSFECIVGILGLISGMYMLITSYGGTGPGAGFATVCGRIFTSLGIFMLVLGIITRKMLFIAWVIHLVLLSLISLVALVTTTVFLIYEISRGMHIDAIILVSARVIMTLVPLSIIHYLTRPKVKRAFRH